jgi:hypothetical protein
MSPALAPMYKTCPSVPRRCTTLVRPSSPPVCSPQNLKSDFDIAPWVPKQSRQNVKAIKKTLILLRVAVAFQRRPSCQRSTVPPRQKWSRSSQKFQSSSENHDVHRPAQRTVGSRGTKSSSRALAGKYKHMIYMFRAVFVRISISTTKIWIEIRRQSTKFLSCPIRSIIKKSRTGCLQHVFDYINKTVQLTPSGYRCCHYCNSLLLKIRSFNWSSTSHQNIAKRVAQESWISKYAATALLIYIYLLQYEFLLPLLSLRWNRVMDWPTCQVQASTKVIQC